MEPRIALKMKAPVFGTHSTEEIEAARDEWVAAYGQIAARHPASAKLCRDLTARICEAARLYGAGVKESVESLDGDFPLGSEREMKLAWEFFTVPELAAIQTGHADELTVEQPYRKEGSNYARKGFLADGKGDLASAQEYYRLHCETDRYPDDNVRERYEQLRDRTLFAPTLCSLREALEQWEKSEDAPDPPAGLSRSYALIRRIADGEEEKAAVRQCEQRILACRQRQLSGVYRRIEACRKRPVTELFAVESFFVPLDEAGRIVKTAVTGIDAHGGPVYAHKAEMVDLGQRKEGLYYYRNSLQERVKDLALSREERAAWFDGQPDWYLLRQSARSLKEKGPLGTDGGPVLRKDLSGLVGGQLDAAAWQNYAIEAGLIRSGVDYDRLLDGLLERLQSFLELCEGLTRES